MANSGDLSRSLLHIRRQSKNLMRSMKTSMSGAAFLRALSLVINSGVSASIMSCLFKALWNCPLIQL